MYGKKMKEITKKKYKRKYEKKKDQRNNYACSIS
jgi:hypothetical protein